MYCTWSSCLTEKIAEILRKFPKIGIFIIYNALPLFKIHTSLLYLSVKISNFKGRGTFFICIRHLLLYPFLHLVKGYICEKMWKLYIQLMYLQIFRLRAITFVGCAFTGNVHGCQLNLNSKTTRHLHEIFIITYAVFVV